MFARCIGMIIFAAILSGSAVRSDAYEICPTATDCLALGKAAVESGQFEQATDPLVAAADLATGASDDQTLLMALGLLVTVNLQLGKPLMAHAWAQAETGAFPDNATAQADLARARQALPAVDPAASISGTYQSYAGHGYWSELRVTARADGAALVDWSLLRFGAVASAYDDGPAAMWDMSADAQYQNGQLVITYQGSDDSPCELTFARTGLAFEWVAPKPEDLTEVCQIGGAGALPMGDFWLVDQTDPQLDDAED